MKASALDADTLRVAMDALDGLQALGRKVGVITPCPGNDRAHRDPDPGAAQRRRQQRVGDRDDAVAATES